MCDSLWGGVKADVLVTDPPYNIDYSGAAGKIKNDNLDDEQFLSFLQLAFKNGKDALRPGGAFYIWYANTEAYNFAKACKDADLHIRQELVWVKDHSTLGRQDFQWKHEPCIYGENDIVEHDGAGYGWNDDGSHSFRGDRKQSTVLEFAKPSKSSLHPTMKPVPLFDYLMKMSSKPGENVLDLFGGSGTTIVAAEQNGRNAFIMEYDPKYAGVILDRWEALTNQKAVRIDG